MNYLASGLSQGWQTGTDAVAQRKKSKDEERRDELRRQLELDVQAKQIAAAKQLQDDRITSDAQRQFTEQTWRTGERTGSESFQAGQGDKDRSWRTGERTGTEGFQSGQNDLDRAIKTLLEGKRLDQERTLNEAAQGFQAKKFDWEKDPTNPRNRLETEHADYFKRGGAPDLPPLPGAQGALNNGAKGGDTLPQPITSQDEYDRLPSGARFNWNGRIGRKP